MGTMAAQITRLTIVYSTVYSRRRPKKTSKLHVTGLVREIHRWQVNSPHKGPVTRKMFPFDDVVMLCRHGVAFQTFAEATANITSNFIDVVQRLWKKRNGTSVIGFLLCKKKTYRNGMDCMYSNSFHVWWDECLLFSHCRYAMEDSFTTVK